jgi:hypothetical protein
MGSTVTILLDDTTLRPFYPNMNPGFETYLLYRDDVKIPDTSEDDYNSRAGAAANATLRIVENIRYYRKRAPRWPVNCPRCHRQSTSPPSGLSPPRKRVQSFQVSVKAVAPIW